jgi:pimeloyl-ACP methyl ester carboxylesterase
MDLIKKVLIYRNSFIALLSIIMSLSCFIGTNQAYGQYLKVEYPASIAQDELQLGVTYTLWIPDGVKTIRGIIVHQHGAGTTAAKSGEFAAYDLHWQALSKKWDCALLAPSYHVLTDKTNDSPGGAQLWFDPRRGSDKAFLKAIAEFAEKSGHPEIKIVPWVLWGHSGGAIWADIMSTLHPERIAALWLRSGAAAMWHGKPGYTDIKIPEEAYSIPTMCNAGIQEKSNQIGVGQLARVKEYRSKGAPVSFSFDPLTGHWTGNSRYLAIPFLDACLSMRLPDKGSKDQTLKHVVMNKSWLAPLMGGQSSEATAYKGNLDEAIWLPNGAVAKMWMEYIETGGVSDNTPPPAPFDVKVTDKGTQGTEIVWNAEADLESGIHHFIILRDGQELGNLPTINLVRFQVRSMFQSGWTESYNDAPSIHIPEMRFVDPWPKDNKTHTYAVISVNTVGLRSNPSEQVTTH